QIRCQLIRLPLSLTRLPYTTLFRSRLGRAREQAAAGERRCEPAQRDQDQGAAGGAEQTQRVDLQQRGLAHALSAGEADPQPRPAPVRLQRARVTRRTMPTPSRLAAPAPAGPPAGARALPAHKTRIVATIGPASEAPETLARLVAAGLGVARLNLSHGDFEGHARVIERLRAASREAGRPLAIL